MQHSEANDPPESDFKKSWIETILLVLIISFGYGMLFLGAYHSYPNAEDLEISCDPRDIGRLHSILALMINYDGRYTTNFLHSINPLTFNWIEGYKVMTILGVLLLNLSMYIFFKLSFKFNGTLNIFFFSTLVTLVLVGCLPSFYESVYYMIGSFVYLYSCSVILFFINAFTKYLRAIDSKTENLFFLLTVSLLILSLGFSELYLPFFLILFIGQLAYFWLNDRYAFKKTLPVFIVGISCIIFYLFTPGIVARLGELTKDGQKSHIIDVLINSIRNYSNAICLVIFNPIFLCTLAFAAIILHENEVVLNIQINRKRKFFYLVVTIVVTYFMTLCYFIPKSDATGNIYRIYTPVLFFLFLLIFAVLSTGVKMPSFLYRLKLLFPIKLFLLLILLVSFVWGKNNIANVWSDYQSKKLQNFKIFMDERIEILEKARSSGDKYKVTYLPQLKDYPRSIYGNPDKEMGRNPVFWNKYYEEYYKIDEVTVIGDTSMRFR